MSRKRSLNATISAVTLALTLSSCSTTQSPVIDNDQPPVPDPIPASMKVPCTAPSPLTSSAMTDVLLDLTVIITNARQCAVAHRGLISAVEDRGL